MSKTPIRVVYSNGVTGAVADIRNGFFELQSAVNEAKARKDLLDLRQVIADLCVELSTIETEACGKLDHL